MQSDKLFIVAVVAWLLGIAVMYLLLGSLRPLFKRQCIEVVGNSVFGQVFYYLTYLLWPLTIGYGAFYFYGK